MTMSGEESDKGRDRRWAQRRSVEMDVVLTDPEGLSCAATVTDISEDGCMIRMASEHDFAPDSLHTIKVSGYRAISGYVIWCSGGKAGLAFSEPLNPAQVQELVMKSHYTRISRNLAKKDSAEDHIPSLPRFPFGN